MARVNIVKHITLARHAVVLMERSVCYQQIVLEGTGNADDKFSSEQCTVVRAETPGSGP